MLDLYFYLWYALKILANILWKMLNPSRAEKDWVLTALFIDLCIEAVKQNSYALKHVDKTIYDAWLLHWMWYDTYIIRKVILWNTMNFLKKSILNQY